MESKKGCTVTLGLLNAGLKFGSKMKTPDRALLNISCNFGGAIADEQKLMDQASDTWDTAGIWKSRNRQ